MPAGGARAAAGAASAEPGAGGEGGPRPPGREAGGAGPDSGEPSRTLSLSTSGTPGSGPLGSGRGGRGPGVSGRARGEDDGRAGADVVAGSPAAGSTDDLPGGSRGDSQGDSQNDLQSDVQTGPDSEMRDAGSHAVDSPPRDTHTPPPGLRRPPDEAGLIALLGPEPTVRPVRAVLAAVLRTGAFYPRLLGRVRQALAAASAANAAGAELTAGLCELFSTIVLRSLLAEVHGGFQAGAAGPALGPATTPASAAARAFAEAVGDSLQPSSPPQVTSWRPSASADAFADAVSTILLLHSLPGSRTAVARLTSHVTALVLAVDRSPSALGLFQPKALRCCVALAFRLLAGGDVLFRGAQGLLVALASSQALARHRGTDLSAALLEHFGEWLEAIHPGDDSGPAGEALYRAFQAHFRALMAPASPEGCKAAGELAASLAGTLFAQLLSGRAGPAASGGSGVALGLCARAVGASHLETFEYVVTRWLFFLLLNRLNELMVAGEGREGQGGAESGAVTATSVPHGAGDAAKDAARGPAQGAPGTAPRGPVPRNPASESAELQGLLALLTVYASSPLGRVGAAGESAERFLGLGEPDGTGELALLAGRGSSTDTTGSEGDLLRLSVASAPSPGAFRPPPVDLSGLDFGPAISEGISRISTETRAPQKLVGALCALLCSTARSDTLVVHASLGESDGIRAVFDKLVGFLRTALLSAGNPPAGSELTLTFSPFLGEVDSPLSLLMYVFGLPFDPQLLPKLGYFLFSRATSSTLRASALLCLAKYPEEPPFLLALEESIRSSSATLLELSLKLSQQVFCTVEFLDSLLSANEDVHTQAWAALSGLLDGVLSIFHSSASPRVVTAVMGLARGVTLLVVGGFFRRRPPVGRRYARVWNLVCKVLVRLLVEMGVSKASHKQAAMQSLFNLLFSALAACEDPGRLAGLLCDAERAIYGGIVEDGDASDLDVLGVAFALLFPNLRRALGEAVAAREDCQQVAQTLLACCGVLGGMLGERLGGSTTQEQASAAFVLPALHATASFLTACFRGAEGASSGELARLYTVLDSASPFSPLLPEPLLGLFVEGGRSLAASATSDLGSRSRGRTLSELNALVDCFSHSFSVMSSTPARWDLRLVLSVARFCSELFQFSAPAFPSFPSTPARSTFGPAASAGATPIAHAGLTPAQLSPATPLLIVATPGPRGGISPVRDRMSSLRDLTARVFIRCLDRPGDGTSLRALARLSRCLWGEAETACLIDALENSPDLSDSVRVGLSDEIRKNGTAGCFIGHFILDSREKVSEGVFLQAIFELLGGLPEFFVYRSTRRDGRPRAGESEFSRLLEGISTHFDQWAQAVGVISGPGPGLSNFSQALSLSFLSGAVSAAAACSALIDSGGRSFRDLSFETSTVSSLSSPSDTLSVSLLSVRRSEAARAEGPRRFIRSTAQLVCDCIDRLLVGPSAASPSALTTLQDGAEYLERALQSGYILPSQCLRPILLTLILDATGSVFSLSTQYWRLFVHALGRFEPNHLAGEFVRLLPALSRTPFRFNGGNFHLCCQEMGAALAGLGGAGPGARRHGAAWPSALDCLLSGLDLDAIAIGPGLSEGGRALVATIVQSLVYYPYSSERGMPGLDRALDLLGSLSSLTPDPGGEGHRKPRGSGNAGAGDGTDFAADLAAAGEAFRVLADGLASLYPRRRGARKATSGAQGQRMDALQPAPTMEALDRLLGQVLGAVPFLRLLGAETGHPSPPSLSPGLEPSTKRAGSSETLSLTSAPSLLDSRLSPASRISRAAHGDTSAPPTKTETLSSLQSEDDI